jgi:sec-independent protein translocase protein TatC
LNTTESLIPHLIELRSRMLRIVIGLLIACLLLLPFAGEIYQLLATPLLQSLPLGGQMVATDVTAPFFVPMKAVLVAAFMLAAPYTLYQAWAFIAPGLYLNERRLITPLVLTSFLLFLCGMAFAYFLVFPVVFSFIISTAPDGVAVMTDIGKYFDFAMTLFIAFGLAFEVPVAVVLLAVTGVVSIAWLREARPYVIVGAFILGAIFTPPDIISQFMLAVPLWLLYEAGIGISILLQRNRLAIKS